MFNFNVSKYALILTTLSIATVAVVCIIRGIQQSQYKHTGHSIIHLMTHLIPSRWFSSFTCYFLEPTYRVVVIDGDRGNLPNSGKDQSAIMSIQICSVEFRPITSCVKDQPETRFLRWCDITYMKHGPVSEVVYT